MTAHSLHDISISWLNLYRNGNLQKAYKWTILFLVTIDTTLPADNSLRFYSLIKMTFTDELKILDDKNKANQAQYDLDGEAAKISLDKY